MRFSICRTLAALVLLGAVSGAIAQPLQPHEIVRAEPDRILLTYSYDRELTPDNDPGVMLIVSRDLFYPRVNAQVTRNRVVVTLSSSMVDALDALGSARPPFLVVDELTLRGRTYRNLIAPLPTAMQLRLVEGVVQNITEFDIEYMTLTDRMRARFPKAWMVNIAGRPFAVSSVQVGSGDSPQLVLVIEGFIPHGAAASVSFRHAPDAEPRVVARGTTPGTRLGNFTGYADIYTGFTFTQSQGADSTGTTRRSTFGVIARFQRFSQLTGFGSPNQLSAGPRVLVRTNSSDQDDEDSLLLSFPFAFTRHRGVDQPTPLIRSIAFDLGPTFESEKTFQNRNLLADGQLSFRFSTRAPAGHATDLRPYIGFDVGQRIWRGPDETPESIPSAIRRLKGGLSGRVALEFSRPYLDKIVFDAEYVYRRLFSDELLLNTRKSIDDVGRVSRSYLNVAVRLAFNPQWELFTVYANGELPPTFVSVHKIQAGLAFRLNAQY